MEFIEEVRKTWKKSARAAKRQKIDEISIGLMEHNPVVNKWVPKKNTAPTLPVRMKVCADSLKQLTKEHTGSKIKPGSQTMT